MNNVTGFLTWVLVGVACLIFLKGIYYYVLKLIELWKNSRSSSEWLMIGLRLMSDKQYVRYWLLFLFLILFASWLNTIR